MPPVFKENQIVFMGLPRRLAAGRDPPVSEKSQRNKLLNK